MSPFHNGFPLFEPKVRWDCKAKCCDFPPIAPKSVSIIAYSGLFGKYQAYYTEVSSFGE